MTTEQTEARAAQAILYLFWGDRRIEEIDTVELQALLETVQAELKYRTPAIKLRRATSTVQASGTG